MAKHRAESPSTLTGTVATRGLLTAVAALAVVGGPAAGMALADEGSSPSTSAGENKATGQDGTNGVDGADGADGTDGADGENCTVDESKNPGFVGADGKHHYGPSKQKLKAHHGCDGKDGTDGERGQDGADAKSTLSGTTPTAGSAGPAGSEAPALGGVSNPFTGVMGDDVGV